MKVIDGVTTAYDISAKKATIDVSVLEGVPKANQDACTISYSEGTTAGTGSVSILAAMDDMTAYLSSGTGTTKKWLGILVDTGESTIIGIDYYSTPTSAAGALGSADVSAAAAVGGAAGEFVIYIACEDVLAAPKTIKLSKAGKTDKSITFTVTDVS
ncbi:MAG: hypothetical protein EOM05_12110 [Clostridia bacterium]|nr:hypothetical protein [Clostridia bacterium]